MKLLLNQVATLRKKSKQYKDEITQLLDIPQSDSDPRHNCFSDIFNNLTLTLELLSYYHSIWSNPPIKVTQEEIVRKKQKNAERCIIILKWLYIQTLSSIEYNIKESVKLYGDKSPASNLIKNNSRIYLGTIINNSFKDELINNDEIKDWKKLIFIRNCIVHNNAISDRDKSFTINGLNVVTHENKMMQGKLNFFAVLTEVAIDRYFTWAKALINRYGVK